MPVMNPTMNYLFMQTTCPWNLSQAFPRLYLLLQFLKTLIFVAPQPMTYHLPCPRRQLPKRELVGPLLPFHQTHPCHQRKAVPHLHLLQASHVDDPLRIVAAVPFPPPAKLEKMLKEK
jgi:hypothetical protein